VLGQIPICVYSRRCQPEMMLIADRPFEIEPIVTAMRAAKGGGTGQHRAGHESWMQLVTAARQAINADGSRQNDRRRRLVKLT
jgi:hypothetical protein